MLCQQRASCRSACCFPPTPARRWVVDGMVPVVGQQLVSKNEARAPRWCVRQEHEFVDIIARVLEPATKEDIWVVEREVM